METYDSTQFSYDKKTNSLSAEASTLQMRTVPIWLHIKSSKTGKVEKFFRYHVDKDREGEIQGWKFISSNPALKQMSVLIIND